MRLPYPMAMILSIGGVMVGMTGPPSDLFFISIGDVKAGALGYCRGWVGCSLLLSFSELFLPYIQYEYCAVLVLYSTTLDLQVFIGDG